MTKYTKSPIDELFYSLMGFYPTKEGAAYEIISAAAISLFEQRETRHNQFVNGLSESLYQLDGLIENDTMIESKDYTKRGAKVGRDDLQKMEGALTDLSEIKKGILLLPQNTRSQLKCTQKRHLKILYRKKSYQCTYVHQPRMMKKVE